MSIKVKHNEKNVKLITQRRLQKIGSKLEVVKAVYTQIAKKFLYEV